MSEVQMKAATPAGASLTASGTRAVIVRVLSSNVSSKHRGIVYSPVSPGQFLASVSGWSDHDNGGWNCALLGAAGYPSSPPLCGTVVVAEFPEHLLRMKKWHPHDHL